MNSHVFKHAFGVALEAFSKGFGGVSVNDNDGIGKAMVLQLIAGSTFKVKVETHS